MIKIRNLIFSLFLFAIILGSTNAAYALNIGITGISSTQNTNMANVLTIDGGHSVTVGSLPTDFSLFDVYILGRTAGNEALKNFVLGGGTLITEWDASEWALNTANLLNATDDGGGFIATGTPVEFTPAGITAGLSTDIIPPNPYSEAEGTEFFRDLTITGTGVEILATRDIQGGGITPAIIGGASGLGSTLIIGYDLADNIEGDKSLGFPFLNEQLLLNAVGYNANSEPVPEPATIALLGIGLAGLAGVGARRKWKKKSADKNQVII